MGRLWRSGGIPGEEGQRGNGAGREKIEGERGKKRHQLCPWTGAGTTRWGRVSGLVVA